MAHRTAPSERPTPEASGHHAAEVPKTIVPRLFPSASLEALLKERSQPDLRWTDVVVGEAPRAVSEQRGLELQEQVLDDDKPIVHVGRVGGAVS